MLMSKDRVYSSLPNPAFRIPGYMRKVTASSGAGSARAAFRTPSGRFITTSASTSGLPLMST